MPDLNAIGLVELSSIAAGYLVADAMLKVADVSLLLSRSICSGKYIVMIGGDVAAVRASVDAGTAAATGMVIDTFVIPNVHAGVFPAIAGTAGTEMLGALGIVEVAAADDLGTTVEALRSTLVRIEPGLMVLPGPTTIEAGERISGARFGEIIRALRTLYPFTVVDVGRELTEASFLAFDLADEIVLVTRAEIMPFKNARLMLDLLVQMGRPSGQIKLVLNRVGARSSLSMAETTGIFRRTVASLSR